jgi:hypothetical protein
MKMDYGNSARGLKDLSAEQQALLVGWIRDVLVRAQSVFARNSYGVSRRDFRKIFRKFDSATSDWGISPESRFREAEPVAGLEPKAHISVDSAGSAPTKPSKPGSGGFVGATSAESPKIHAEPDPGTGPSLNSGDNRQSRTYKTPAGARARPRYEGLQARQTVTTWDGLPSNCAEVAAGCT